MAIDLTTNLSQTLYNLLCAKYMNNRIASNDIRQFKLKVFTLIYEYGPAWKTRLKLQENLANMDPDSADVSRGTTAIYNHAENDDTDPSTETTPIEYQTIKGLNSQNTTSYKRGKLEGYDMLATLIETDVTEEFLGKFRKLFLKFSAPDGPEWFALPGSGDEGLELANFANAMIPNYRSPRFIEIWENYNDFYADYSTSGIPMTI